VAAGELQEIVQFPGPVTGDAKWEEYKNSDLFFFPSYYSVEGMSVAVIEAMSAGIPVIVSRWRGQVDLVEPGRTGFLVEPRDISGYVDCIESLYKDPALRVECGQGARLRFSELFTEAKHLECLESALLPVLEE
jgi:glycosyltransferase involved in cell wall biosynthesis